MPAGKAIVYDKYSGRFQYTKAEKAGADWQVSFPYSYSFIVIGHGG
jgi:hypothetical protein